jgi:hypothetical protein
MMNSYIFVRVTAVVGATVPILRIVYLWGRIKYLKRMIIVSWFTLRAPLKLHRLYTAE